MNPHSCDAVQPKSQKLNQGERWIYSSGVTYGLLESDLGPLGLHLNEEDTTFQSVHTQRPTVTANSSCADLSREAFLVCNNNDAFGLGLK